MQLDQWVDTVYEFVNYIARRIKYTVNPVVRNRELADVFVQHAY